MVTDNLMYMEASAILSEWAEIEKCIQKVLGRKRVGVNRHSQREREQVQNCPISLGNRAEAVPWS